MAGIPGDFGNTGELGGDLRGGVRRPHHSHGRSPEGAHPRIVRRMPLRAGKQSRVGRNEGSRPGTGGGYDMGSRPRPIAGVEAVASSHPLDAVHVHGALDGDPVALLIVGKVVDDMVRRWKPLVGWHRLARQAGKLRGGKQRH